MLTSGTKDRFVSQFVRCASLFGWVGVCLEGVVTHFSVNVFVPRRADRTDPQVQHRSLIPGQTLQ